MHLQPPSKSSPNQANVEEEDGQTNAGNAHLDFQMSCVKLTNANCVSILFLKKSTHRDKLADGGARNATFIP